MGDTPVFGWPESDFKSAVENRTSTGTQREGHVQLGVSSSYGLGC